MAEPASDYAKIDRAVADMINARAKVNDPTVRAYMVARSALLHIRALRGSERAAEVAFKLADELAVDGVR